MRDYRAIYNEWLRNPYFDEETKQELRAISDDENEIMERFYMDLEFGTAGLRGIIGAGTNRMNKYVVRRATQGLCNYILRQNGADKGVVIAYDSRHMSPEFSDECARTLAANGIKAYRFESLRPTPELSFAVRKLGCIAGINITASHNPSKYNGYKVYWEDGAQFTPPIDEEVTKEVLAISDLARCKTMSRDEAEKRGLYITIGKEIDDEYIAKVLDTIINKDVIEKMDESINIVYTPLNGTGHVPVMRVLKELGFTNVHEVPEQAWPDADFTTVPYPNPEIPDVYELALKLAIKTDADLILATDPDADRLGIYVKKSESGEFVPFTGNMTSTLLCEYILSQRKIRGEIPQDAFVVESIVSTDMIKAVAKNYDCEVREVLTGFKWIGREIAEADKSGKGTFMYGMEESYGNLVATYTRDKDAVSAVASLCEAVAFYKDKGLTLWDVMQKMYEHYGYYNESVKTIEMDGREGIEHISRIMEEIRKAKPKEIGRFKVEKIRDYKEGYITFVMTGKTEPTALPPSNVLYFELEGDSWVCVRPSGTEPKLKLYAGVKGQTREEALNLGREVLKAFSDAFVKV